jgi:hypothetical protein
MPGPVFVASVSAARRHGVYALERATPPSIRAIGTGVCALCAQLPWGPDQVLVTPSGLKDLYDTIAPAGMDRTWSGYLSLIRKAWPTIKYVRVLGPTAAAAQCALGANVALVVARSKGSSGNSLLATVSNASDGDPNHFDLAVSVAGASGVTTDSAKNLNLSGTGLDSVVDTKRSLLIGRVQKTASGRPPNGTYAFSGGVDGVLNAGAYTGAQGAADRGLALFETDGSIRKVFTDDPGNAMRAAVNGALRAHAESLGDRVAFLNGPQGQSLSDVKTDVSNYRSVRAVYVDPWPYVLDDVDGTKRLVPPAPFAASVAAQLSPSTSIAWKDPKVIAMLGGIVDLEVDRGQGAADNTDQGVATLIREENGGYSLEAGVLTVAPLDPSRRNLTRTQTGDYIAVSFQRSVRAMVDAPNVPLNQDALVLALEVFMDGMKKAAKTDPNNRPHVLDYAIPPLATVNSDSDTENGNLFLPLDAKTSPAAERIFLSIQFGENARVRHEA